MTENPCYARDNRLISEMNNGVVFDTKVFEDSHLSFLISLISVLVLYVIPIARRINI